MFWMLGKGTKLVVKLAMAECLSVGQIEAGETPALAGYAAAEGSVRAEIAALAARLKGIAGVATVHDRAGACAEFELPPDRVGDLVVTSTREKALGTSPELHDLSGLDEPLRSHGGLTEQRVPMIANVAITPPAGHRLRNFDVFAAAMNWSA